jgi:hypothetical protein
VGICGIFVDFHNLSKLVNNLHDLGVTCRNPIDESNSARVGRVFNVNQLDCLFRFTFDGDDTFNQPQNVANAYIIPTLVMSSA